ncbi:MAG: hypothetical protein MUO85_08490 [candidate division Zixibacteria bacterium]|nr:hypothetical protein [candidate division Zixibacteria bacterium]
MGKVKKITLLVTSLLLLETGYANADFRELIDQPIPMIVLSVLLLLLTVAGFWLSSRIRAFLRGGELIVGWFLILVSFLFLFGSQVLELGRYLDVFEVSLTVVYVAKLFWLMILVLGIYFIQKVMS